MNAKPMTFALIAGLTAVPHDGYAATFKEALEACAAAVTEQLADSRESPLTFRIETPDASYERRMYARTMFLLDVAGAKDSQPLARANCVVSRGGDVQQLTMLPLEG